MSEFGSSEQEQRPSRTKKKWPKWLRNPRVLRAIVWMGIWIYRIWRFIQELFGPGGG